MRRLRRRSLKSATCGPTHSTQHDTAYGVLSWSCGAEYLGMKIADMNSDGDAMARLAEVRESLYRLITFWPRRRCGSHGVVVSPATVYKLSQTYHKSGIWYTVSPSVGVISSFSRLCCCYLRPLLYSPTFYAYNAGGPNVDRGVRSARFNPYAFETRNRFTQSISFTLLFGRKVLLLYCFIQLFTLKKEVGCHCFSVSYSVFPSPGELKVLFLSLIRGQSSDISCPCNFTRLLVTSLDGNTREKYHVLRLVVIARSFRLSKIG